MWQSGRYVAEWSLCEISVLYVGRLVFMGAEWSLCMQSDVYVVRVVYVWSERSLCDRSGLYVCRVIPMWVEWSMCSMCVLYMIQSDLNVGKLVFMLSECRGHVGRVVFMCKTVEDTTETCLSN